jgi:hypothetical protein
LADEPEELSDGSKRGRHRVHLLSKVGHCKCDPALAGRVLKLCVGFPGGTHNQKCSITLAKVADDGLQYADGDLRL